MEKKLNIIIGLLITILLGIIIIGFQLYTLLDKSHFTFLKSNEGVFWKINTETGIGCVVNDNQEVKSDMFLLGDFSNCITK